MTTTPNEDIPPIPPVQGFDGDEWPDAWLTPSERRGARAADHTDPAPFAPHAPSSRPWAPIPPSSPQRRRKARASDTLGGSILAILALGLGAWGLVVVAWGAVVFVVDLAHR